MGKTQLDWARTAVVNLIYYNKRSKAGMMETGQHSLTQQRVAIRVSNVKTDDGEILLCPTLDLF